MEYEIEYDEKDLDTRFGDNSVKGKDSDDLDRDSVIGFRVGAKFLVNDEMFVRGEFAAVGEKSFTIGAGTRF